MLHLHSFSQAKDKHNWLTEFYNPDEQTLLVADLETKTSWQRKCLSFERPLLLEDSVLRATEFWNKLLKRSCPSVSLASPSLIRAIVSQWLAECPWDWGKAPGSVKLTYEAIEQFLPILSSGDGAQLMAQWFQENKESYLRWGQWFELAHQVWLDLGQRQLITAQWIPALLVGAEDLADMWRRDLIVDLGADINSLEADLFKTLSSSVDVHILRPQPQWESSYFSTLWPYCWLEDKNIAEEHKKSEGQQALTEIYSTKGVNFQRYTTELAEVKAAISFVRQQLDIGVPAHEIVVAAPDIETYWRVLSRYAREEGIPCAKSDIAILQSFPAVAHWLSILRVKMGGIKSSDIESAYFYKRNEGLSYEKFRQLFQVVYDEEDLRREKSVHTLFAQEMTSESVLDRDEFVSWAIKFWSDEETEVIQRLFDQFLQECPPGMKVQGYFWLDYLQQLCARVEVPIQQGVEGGVKFVNVDELQSIEFNSLFVLGLTEKALKESRQAGLNAGEVIKISRDLGFPLAFPDRAKSEFKLRWLLDRGLNNVTLSVAANDFSGNVTAFSLLWLRGCLEKNGQLIDFSVPDSTRWDDLQKSSEEVLVQERGWDEMFSQLLWRQLKEDVGSESPKEFAKEAHIRLSVSQLEKYGDCPFKFAAEKIYGLQDLGTVDLDVDAATKGTLIHALFRRLTEEPMQWKREGGDLIRIIEACREEVRYPFVDSTQWSWLLARFVKMAQSFLQIEQERRQEFPHCRIVGREVKVRGEWLPEESALGPVGSGGVPFVGSIDRVDQNDKGQYLAIDYKSSGNGLTHHGSWMSNNKLQLALYAQAIEQGLTELKAGPVVGSLYYVVKDFSLEKGYCLPEVYGQFLPPNKSRGQKITKEQLQGLYLESNDVVAERAYKISQGEFPPKPMKLDDCHKCRWRTICRAPHLN